MRKIYFKTSICFFSVLAVLTLNSAAFASDESVARKWNKALLVTIRNDFARPTIHARNLFHVSIAMYDAWAVYSDSASTYLLGRTLGNYTSQFLGIPPVADVESARNEAISYACYRLLKQRFQGSPGAGVSMPYIDSLMNSMGYDPNFASLDYLSGSAAALGNYIASEIISFGFTDGSNQQNGYANQYYQPVNPHLTANFPGNPLMADPNRWQPIYLDEFIDQSGNVITITPPFLSPEWGNVVPFSMDSSLLTTYERDGDEFHVYHDPGAPPYLDTNSTEGMESIYKWGFLMVSLWQAHLDGQDTVMWDISPGSMGNVSSLPQTFEEYPSFYNMIEGGDNSPGHPLNPVTGLPYEPQLVKRGDFTRVLAEFWADGPSSETPPGHWNVIMNYVADHPQFEKRWNGTGPILPDLEWDVKSYLTLNGAMHDAAITAWSIKGWYDYTRPISAIRWMADKGQCSDTLLPHYHKAGLPLVPGYVELVMPGDTLAGANNEHLYKIKLYTWRGHPYIDSPDTSTAGVGWILAENWWPYQRPSFVTPPFAGFISGHSTFSRTAAEIMTLITGTRYFPGGLAEFHAEQNAYLHFEDGPSQSVTLQWATFQDASDQCSLSRIWGGIHPPQDDIAGRLIGMELGPEAFNFAQQFIWADLPKVVAVTPSAPVINTNALNGDFYLDIVYDQAMDTMITPTIYSGNAQINLFQETAHVWLSDSICRVYVAVPDTAIEQASVELRVLGAKGISGWPQKVFVQDGLLGIDTQIPTVVAATVNQTDINSTLIGTSVLVTVEFSEAMDTASTGIFALESPIPTAVLNLNEQVWLTPTVLRANFDVLNVEEECFDIQLHIAASQDVNANAMNAYIHPVTIDVETRLPLVSTLLASTYNVGPQDASLELFVLFDEPMQTTEAPAFTFNSTFTLAGLLSANESASAWLNPYSYKAVYSINSLDLVIADVDIGIQAARDVAGNPMANFEGSDYLDIDQQGLSVSYVNQALPEIYPNPVRQGQPIQLNARSKSEFRWSLLQSDGRLIQKGLADSAVEKISLPSESLSPGLYFLRIDSPERSHTARLLIVP